MNWKNIDKNDLWVITVLVFLFGFIAYLCFREKRLTKEFYKMKINSRVVKRSGWQKRSIDFYLDNGVDLNFLASSADKRMKIGDSVSKPKNTFIYVLYRKNEDSVMMQVATYNYTIQQ